MLLVRQDRQDLKARLDQLVIKAPEGTKVQLAIKVHRVLRDLVVLEADRVLRIWSIL
ncbi:hypothetical protein [uncultured Actinomyces sp.]|uniref:hypothetical protein n=1 Tax=uncultured Actinomyces sp. TaxID=249061 RepID=UPI0028D777FC|nr:hypothetical protein [uncultured Actinomyces sp.]